jgi:putative spermidine/putrescine transport system permease protein
VTGEAATRGRWLTGAVTLAVLIFLLMPLLILMVQSFTAESHLSFPPARYGVRWYRHIFTARDWLSAMSISLLVAAVVTPAALGLGTAAALGLDRGPARGRRELYTLMISPMVLPHIILGLGLLRVLLWLGLTDTIVGFVLAHLTIAIPYVVVMVSASLATFDRAAEEAAQSLGASPARALWHVTLPMIRPGLIAGAIFSFIASFDEFIMTYFLATHKMTLPIQIFSSLSYDVDPSIAAVSGLMVILTATLTSLLVARGQVPGGARLVP